jgi:hypothetical protein
VLLRDPKYQGMLLNKATSFFNDIQSGKYLGIISKFTETEYRSVVKKVISSLNSQSITSIEEKTALDDFEQFTQRLGIGLTNSDLIAIEDSSNIGIFEIADVTMQSSIPFYHSKRKEWKIIGGADAILINLAIRSGATMFATFDRGFKGLQNTNISPLIIPEVY